MPPTCRQRNKACVKENMRYWCAAHPNMGSRASSWLSSRDTHLERRPGSHTARSADDGAMPDTASSADGAMPDDTRSFNVVGDPFHRLYHRPGSHLERCNLVGDPFHRLYHRPGSHLEIHISFHRLYHRPAGKAPELPYHDFPRGEQMTPSPTRRWRSPPRPRRRSKGRRVGRAELRPRLFLRGSKLGNWLAFTLGVDALDRLGAGGGAAAAARRGAAL